MLPPDGHRSGGEEDVGLRPAALQQGGEAALGGELGSVKLTLTGGGRERQGDVVPVPPKLFLSPADCTILCANGCNVVRNFST